MVPGRRLRPLLSALLLGSLALSGCATPKRLPAVPANLTASADTGLGPIRYLVDEDVGPMATEALAAARREQAWLASQGHAGTLPPLDFLAISGGGDNGAFGAGLLKGWSERGDRPSFKVVTGISTGALIAPFAFMGSDYDHVLETVYTTTSQADILRKRGIFKGLTGDAMADSAPLMKLVERFVDQPLLDRIAAEYAKGRLLFISTTDLDALQPVIWNMTAIAASRDPRALPLFRRLLVASASIPGIFPPVMIDVTAGGQAHQEMHVDGGTISQVFFYPPQLGEELHDAIKKRQRTLYVIRNARLAPDWADVKRGTVPVAVRAISSLTQTQGVGDLYRIFATSRRDGFDFHLAFIPPDFTRPHPAADFDTAYMQDLFATGRRMAAAGYPWHKAPPGFAGER